MLQVLDGHKALEEQQDMVESHLAELQSKVEESATSTQVVMEKGKKAITRTLSASSFTLYI